ncbi:serine-rich protein Tye7p [Monosporozyma servazzii]
MLSATSNNNNMLNDNLFHYADISSNNNNNDNNIDNNINNNINNNISSNDWFDTLDNNIFTPQSTTSSTSLESPLTFQNIVINNNKSDNYPSVFKTLRFDSLMTKQQRIKIKKEPSIQSTPNPQPTKNRSSRKRLTQHQKEAHNRIEKRYRININTKIAKLQQIIPWVASNDTAFQVSDTLPRDNNNTASSTKLNKSMVLEKALDYILFLQNNQHLYELELQRLRNELDSLRH